jgi:hypothetical protein
MSLYFLVSWQLEQWIEHMLRSAMMTGYNGEKFTSVVRLYTSFQGHTWRI